MIEKSVIPNGDKAVSAVSSWGLRIVGAREVLLFSGIAAVASDGSIVAPGDPVAQTRWIYASFARMLASVGASFADVVRIETTVTQEVSQEQRAGMRAVLEEVFGSSTVKPVAGTHRVVVSLARPGMLVEIEILALR